MNHLELFRTGMEAFNEGDADAFLDFVDPDCEWYPFLLARATEGPYRGREGVREWLRSIDGAFDHLYTEAHDVHDLGDRLVALGEIRYRARNSDVEASAPIAWLFEFRGELLWKGRVFMRHEEALEAAGLDPSAGATTR